MFVFLPDLLAIRVSFARTHTMSRPDAFSVPPIITGWPAGLSMPRSLSSGATTSGLFDAPAYSPISPTVGPLTMPPSANFGNDINADPMAAMAAMALIHPTTGTSAADFAARAMVTACIAGNTDAAVDNNCSPHCIIVAVDSSVMPDKEPISPESAPRLTLVSSKFFCNFSAAPSPEFLTLFTASFICPLTSGRDFLSFSMPKYSVNSVPGARSSDFKDLKSGNS